MSAGVRTLSTAALLAFLAAVPVVAQDAPLTNTAPPPANLAFVEGGVDLIHEGAAERADAGMLLTDGDLVRTLNGRAEIVFADGTLLHLDHNTELELLSPVRLRLVGGRLAVRSSSSAATYVIDTQAASVRLGPRGEYGVTADGRLSRLELTVARGVATIDDASTRTIVNGGEMASILGAGGRVLLQEFNSARWGAFERWSNDRANGFSTAASAGQLPSELRPYGAVLDSYGRWDYIAPYGNVWFPAVGASWRPYYTGAWRQTRYGWTWIGHDPWAWPTHHYGRWGFTGAAWYWIPARVWGPAWVSWSFSPGYVSWCPLGWDGRAVVGYTHVSSWLRGGRDHPDYRPHYDPWRAWTIMPRDHFDHRRPVRTHAIDPTRLPDDTRRAMANVAVPRESVGVSASARPDLPASGPAAHVVPRGFVRIPNAAPPTPPAPSASAAARPDLPASDGETSPKRPEVQRREGGPSIPAAVPDARWRRRDDPAQSPRVYTPPPSDDRADTPRSYTPPAYAVPRSEGSRQPERAEDQPSSGGRVRSPSAAPRSDSPARSGGTSAERPATRSREGGRESGETRAAPPPQRRSGGEGQSSRGGGGGAVRRRPQ